MVEAVVLEWTVNVIVYTVLGATTRQRYFLLLFSLAHLLQHFENIFFFSMIHLRAVLAAFDVRVEVWSIGDHLQVAATLMRRIWDKHQWVCSIFKLLKRLQHVFKLRREKKFAFFLLRFFAEEEEKHKSFQFLTVFLLHVAHHTRKSLVLRSDGLILLHQDLHHTLELFMLLPQHCNLLLQSLLARSYRNHCPLRRLFSRCIFTSNLQKQLSKLLQRYKLCFWKFQ